MRAWWRDSSQIPWPHLLAALVAATLALLALSLLTGPTGFGLPQAEARWLIMTEVRTPRALLGLLVGASLGIAGASLQGYLRNPLGEPGVVGTSAGAALGAVVAIHTGLAASVPLALPLGGLAGAAAATLTVIALAGRHGGTLTLVLAGVAVSAAATALTSLALNLSSNPFAAVEMVFWLMGSLADRSTTQLFLAAPIMIAGQALLLALARPLDALSLGEDVASNLGVDLARTRLLLVAGTAMTVGGATAVTGIIPYIGLIVPHVLRPLVGHAPGRLLTASLLAGAIMLLAADLLLRLVAPGGALRLGVLTAIVGSPFFIWLVVSTRTKLTP
jgi:iron complex transport system permease protein